VFRCYLDLDYRIEFLFLLLYYQTLTTIIHVRILFLLNKMSNFILLSLTNILQMYIQFEWWSLPDEYDTWSRKKHELMLIDKSANHFWQKAYIRKNLNRLCISISCICKKKRMGNWVKKKGINVRVIIFFLCMRKETRRRFCFPRQIWIHINLTLESH
jgi:hypothetical protein